MNKANVLMMSGHIPQNSLFKSYKDLKRHWKNSYGYRLPDSEEGLVYVTVKFGRWFSESLTYPIMCVRARRPVFLRQLEPQRVLLEILADLHSKVPTICGHPFGIDATVRYALPKLNSLSQILFPCNLTEVKPEIRRVREEVSNSQPVSQYTQSLSGRASSQVENKGSSRPLARSQSPPPFLPRLSQLIPPSSAKPVFVPIFNPKTRAPLSTAPSPPPLPHPSEEELPASATVRPVFGGIPMKPVFGLAQSSPTFQTNKTLTSQFKKKSIAPFPLFGSPKHSFNPRGEKTLLNFPGSSNKKVRNKPQVQPGVDVEVLAHTRGGLDKINTTTIIAYLRSQGVPCKVKDKKGDLVNKVLTHLNLPVVERLPLPSTQTSTASPSCPERNKARVVEEAIEI